MIVREEESILRTTLPVAGQEESAASARPATQDRCVSSQKLRVLHVFSYLGLGGTELTAIRVIRGLESQGFESRLCGMRGFDEGVMAARFPGADIVSPMAKQSSFKIAALVKIIKEYRPHIVHSRNWGAIEAVLASRLEGVPVVIHSEHGYEVETVQGLPMRRRLFRRAMYGMADAMFAVTGELRTYHAQQAWISPSRIRVIANGIDTNLFAPRLEMRRSILDRLNIPSKRFVIGSVGRLVPIKDQMTLLKAGALLVERGADVHLLLAGTGSELNRLQEFVGITKSLQGRASFVGTATNVAEMLNAMDVFVLPSISEGMSNTLLEAMASGLPTLATHVGGNPEVMGDTPPDSFFAPGDVKALAEKLERVAGDAALRQEVGDAARQRAVRLFSVERMVADYRNLYLEMAAKRGIPVRSGA